jgi:hypothetical protein
LADVSSPSSTAELAAPLVDDTGAGWLIATGCDGALEIQSDARFNLPHSSDARRSAEKR